MRFSSPGTRRRSSDGQRGFVGSRDGSITEIVALASDAEAVDTACRSAAVAAADLQRLSLVQRAEMLVRLAAALDREAEELIQVADRETALGATRLAGELTRTTNQLRLFATVITDAACFDAVIDHADAQSTPRAGPATAPGSHRTGGGLRCVQLPVCILGGRW